MKKRRRRKKKGLYLIAHSMHRYGEMIGEQTLRETDNARRKLFPERKRDLPDFFGEKRGRGRIDKLF